MAKNDPERQEAQPAKRWSSQITAIGGFIAAMIPLTAAVNGWYSVQLEREKYFAELRLKYVDRALDPTKDPTYRESFFTFILETTPHDDPLYHWSRRRLDNAQQIIKLREQIAAQTVRVGQIGELLVKERASHLQDEKAAAAREQALKQTARTALRQRLVSEEALRRAEIEGGYRGTGTQLSSAQAVTNAVAEADEPKITLAWCRGRSSVRIAGRRFGNQTGTVYAGRASEVAFFGEPEKLAIHMWNDNEIDVGVGSDCESVLVLSGKRVWVQRPDSRLSNTAEVIHDPF